MRPAPLDHRDQLADALLADLVERLLHRRQWGREHRAAKEVIEANDRQALGNADVLLHQRPQ